jgi:arabinogalactan endo-1,4-beta-galactosidase
MRPRVRFAVLAATAIVLSVVLLQRAPAPTPTGGAPAATPTGGAPAPTPTGSATALNVKARPASQREPMHTALDIALSPDATATASTEANGAPAANAIDGSATTQWCSTQWTGNVTVDLGRTRTVDGLGLTLGDKATTALVNFSAGNNPNNLQPVQNATQQSVHPNNPAYWPAPRNRLTARYVKVDVTDNDGTPPCIGELRLFAAMPLGTIPERGADLSFERQEEAAGAHFTDAGAPGTPLSILTNHGLNYVRLRLWVNPPQGYSDLASDLAMARRIKAAGDKLYLDIHYSDFWADPQHQDIPAAWQGQDLAALTNTVQAYTSQVIKAFAKQGTPVDMVSIGNEIRNGILWPVGQVNWSADTGWDNLTTLLKAGVAGARAANPPHHPFQIMLHFDEGGNNADSVRFYDHMVSAGVPFDVIGLSYYTFFHGPVTAMRSNVDDLATRYGKPIVIAESQYPWTLAAGDSTGNFVWQTSQVPDGYPDTPGGQLSFYNDLLSIIHEIPNHLGTGLFYWEPEWIPGVGWEPGAGTPNDNLTLFSFSGQALPSVGLFQSPLQVCARFDPIATPCEVPDGASSAPSPSQWP